MIPGIFGWSLILELFVLYFALNVWLTNVDKRWLYLLLGIIVLISISDLTGARWVEIFSGHYDFLWREIFENFGFR